MLRISLTPADLKMLSEMEIADLRKAISRAFYYERMAREGLPHNVDIIKGNIWELATARAAKRLLTGYPANEEIKKDEEWARKEVQRKGQNGDWISAVFTIEKILKCGEADFKIPDDYIIPPQLIDEAQRQDKAVCIAEHRAKRPSTGKWNEWRPAAGM